MLILGNSLYQIRTDPKDPTNSVAMTAFFVELTYYKSTVCKFLTLNH